ncbi:MAG: hypothetical protein IAE82_08340 [Opitutaceae bacterium]|nr:hypothetical protein [Opitutaceae bacterium]
MAPFDAPAFAATMRHYCTYFDSGFLIQGVALWHSLQRHDPGSVLWVLALDEEAALALERIGSATLRVARLSDLEAADQELAAVKTGRSRAEYIFTLSPCLPRWLLRTHSALERIVYLDADVLLWGPPDRIYPGQCCPGAHVVITAHRFPSWAGYLEQHGRFNVGVQVFANTPEAHAVLDDWRSRCLEWCYDRLEGDRYADQKYLDAWPERFGPVVGVLEDPGVNLAPWNWMAHQCEVDMDGEVRVDGRPLVLFHFARFRPLAGSWFWQSGQLQYGVMPWSLRQAIYGVYWQALEEARRELARCGLDRAMPVRATRAGDLSMGGWLLRLVCGSDWVRIGSRFFSCRLGLGRYSGRVLAWRARHAESTSRTAGSGK